MTSEQTLRPLVAREQTPEPEQNGHDERPRATIVRLSEVPTSEVNWLWDGYIAIGKLTLIVGDPGVGKSYLSLDLAARISTGKAWPDGSSPNRSPGSVFLIAAEDGASDTIRPRVMAAGGDLERVVLFTEPRDQDGNPQWFNLKRHIPQLEWAVGQMGDTKLIVIDPITAFSGGVDERSQGAVREMLRPLSEMAARLGVAVVLISHPNKNEGGKAAYRTTGSLAYNALARAVWYVMKDPSDNERRLLLAVKNNLAADTFGRAFRIVERRLEWERDAVLVTPDEVLAAETAARQKSSRLQDAISFLKQKLAGGAVAADEIKVRGEAEGLSERTLTRAKSEAQIGSKKFKTDRGSQWFWYLPGMEPASLDECLSDDGESRAGELEPDEDQRTGLPIYPGPIGNQAAGYNSGYGQPYPNLFGAEVDPQTVGEIPF